MSENQKNKNKFFVSDIRFNHDRADFGLDKREEALAKSNIENHENDLIKSLQDDQETSRLNKKREELKQKKREAQIRREARSFKFINFDNTFGRDELPTRIVSSQLKQPQPAQEKKSKNNQDEARVEDESQEQKNWPEIRQRQEEQREREAFELEKFEYEKIEKARELELQKIREAEKIRQEKLLQAKLHREKQARERKAYLDKQKQIEIAKRQKNEELALKQKLKEEAREDHRKLSQKRKTEREWKINQIKQNLSANPSSFQNKFSFWKPAFVFSGACAMIFLLIFSSRFVFYGIQIKDQVVVKGAQVVADLEKTETNFKNQDFSQMVLDFQNIQKNINEINQNLNQMEGGLPSIVSRLPFVSKYDSAKNLLEGGNEMAQAMVLISQSMKEFSQISNPLEPRQSDFSLGEVFLNLESKMLLAEQHLKSAQVKIRKVDPKDLPETYQSKVENLQDNFSQALNLLSEFNQKQNIFRDLLGYKGPRKYLFLFQNNQEMRATGGFIGSYGVLSTHNGGVEDFFVDGIFNPDGQLSTRIIPPKPIQKISANWSTHDANWFPSFPTSAKKIAWFYEKTGGPTVDGIITLTPTVMEKLLKITGPIEMPEYETTVTENNFVEKTQFEVELDYDEEKNRPKQFIADLTPKVLNKIFSQEQLGQFPEILKILSEALTERHILIYSENSEIQNMISDLGWSGEILNADKDYLMVVNSNINGYKTDGVIDQAIDHKIEIEPDGSVVDTVTIERFHNGGSSEYEWWNKVNANYMRVYVPQGSQLLEVKGHTRETVEDPVNYNKLGFVEDDLVSNSEKSIKIDPKTGTEIWKEEGKTVFANWVYVSPQEKVKVTYKYKLPFKLDVQRKEGKMDNYSVLYQKQSGMNTTELNTEIKLADDQRTFWHYPTDLQISDREIQYQSNLKKDRFIGVVVE